MSIKLVVRKFELCLCELFGFEVNFVSCKEHTV